MIERWVRPLAILVALTMVIVGIGLAKAARFPDLASRQVRADVLAGPLDTQHDLTQTFTSSKPGLSRVGISFRSLRQRGQEEQAPALLLELKEASGRLVATSAFSVPVGPRDFDLQFDFPPQARSSGQQYELRIKTDANPETVAAWSSGYDIYPPGTLQSDGIPADRDLTFSASSSLPSLWWTAAELEKFASRAAALLGVSIAFTALGFMAGLLLSARSHPSPISALAYALPAGISLPPILFWLLGLLGMRIQQGVLAGFAVALVLASLWRLANLRKSLHEIRIPWVEVSTLGLLFVLAIITRLIQIDGLVVPNWVDGVMHAGVVRDIKRLGALPPGNPYHVGFHANVIVTQILTGLSVAESMLVYGQWLGAAAGLCFYLLARTLFRDWRVALLVTGLYLFVAPFPAYLFTWGRYALLQGLVLLPPAAALILRGVQRDSPRLLLALILTGLFLSHYGAIFLAIILLVAVLIHERYLRRGFPALRSLLAAAVVMVPVSAAAGTKIVGLLGSTGWAAILSRLNHSVNADEFLHLLSILLGRGGSLILVIGAAGAAAAMWANSDLLRLIALWALGVLALYVAQDHLFGISAFGAQNAVIFISLPLCILCGVVVQGLFRSGGRLLTVLICGTAGFLILAGAYNTSAMLNPETVLFSPGDRAAMAWIRHNTMPKSIILIDSFIWERHYVASDAGAWITQLTGRKTIFLKQAEEMAQLETILSLRRVDYVYLGSGNGDLALHAINSRLLELVYQENGSRIYRVRTAAACADATIASLAAPGVECSNPPSKDAACCPRTAAHTRAERRYA